MIQINKPKIEVLEESAAIFAEALETDSIDLSAHQIAQVVITTDAPQSEGADITESTTLTVCATDGTTDTAIPFKLIDEDGEIEEVPATGKVITIGANALYIVELDADKLGKLGLKDVVIKTTAVTSCIIQGTIIAVLSAPRYND